MQFKKVDEIIEQLKVDMMQNLARKAELEEQLVELERNIADQRATFKGITIGQQLTKAEAEAEADESEE